MYDAETIDLFGGYTLTASEARTAILAHTRADVIREWCVLLPNGDPASSLWYAGVRPHSARRPPDRSAAIRRIHGPSALYARYIIGRGASPAGALADLLWQIVTPHLLMAAP